MAKTKIYPVRQRHDGILCAAFSKNPSAVSKHRVIAQVSGGAMAQVTGPGIPLAWLP